MGNQRWMTRGFAAGSAAFQVCCPSRDLVVIVEQVFSDLSAPDRHEPCSTITLSADEVGKLRVMIGGVAQGASQHLSAALASLVSAVSRLSLDSDANRLHLHCAALVRDSKGVLLSAPSGTGKTTFAAALMARGWSYVSDEAVALDSVGSASGFPKPLTFRPGGSRLVPRLKGSRVAVPGGDDSYWIVPAGSAGASIEAELDPAAIVLLRVDPLEGTAGGNARLRPIHPVDAVVGLMAQTMDPGRFGPGAFGLLAGLAARCRCVELSVATLESMADALDSVLDSDAPADVVPCELEPARGVGVGWEVAPDVRSMLIGDRVVVHRFGGAIVSLDVAGTAVWLYLHGEPPAWWDPSVVSDPATGDFLRALEGYGLLRQVDRVEVVSR